MDELRRFIDDYLPDQITHEPTGIQMGGYIVLRQGDTYVRFVHEESDEAQLVRLVRSVLDQDRRAADLADEAM